jgi:hypothetical protein
MQCPFSIRHKVLPDVNSQLRGFDDDIDVLRMERTEKDRGLELRTMDNKVTGED